MNADQIARIEEAEAFALSPFGKAGNQEPGNPLGSNGRFFGAGYVMVHSECHTSLLNRAVAIEEVHLNEATRYFEEFGIPPRFDLAPALRSPGWNAWMEEHEFEIESYPMMGRRIVAGPAVHTALSTGMDIRAIQDNDLDSLIEIMASAFNMSFLRRATARDWARVLVEEPNTYSFLAWAEGKPVACGMLAIHNRVAYLGTGATLDGFRGRGLQTAMIQHRINVAADLGCDLACSLVAPDSGSERNLRRCGLVDGYDREIWMPKTRWEHPFYKQ